MLKGITLYLLIFTVLPGFFRQGFAQPPTGTQRGGIINGTIIDEADGSAIEYAYIVLYSESDSSQILGTVSSEDGQFLIRPVRPGRYYLEIKYMGFNTETVHGLTIGRNQRRIDLGEVALTEAISKTGAIEVLAEKPAITYLIDKKVINVSQHQTATSGTAADVLENVPSVTVDIEGNVALRGSNSFIVLIDHKPTILEPSEVLQQIPASAIEDIEIITNPSAKFDPDGTSGIINIITKKDALNGFNGIVNLNTGLDDKYGVDFKFNYRIKKLNVYLGADFNNRNYPGNQTEDRHTTFENTTSFISSRGSSDRLRRTYGVKGGLDYSISKKDNLSLGFRYGGRSMTRESELDYEQWTDVDVLTNYYSSINQSERLGNFLALNLDYRHEFVKKGHQLVGQIIYRSRESDEESLDELRDDSEQIVSGRKTTEQGPSAPLRMKLDYTLPIGKKNKFEAGYQSRLGHSEDLTRLYEYSSQSAKYELLPNNNSRIIYNRDIHALYSMYAADLGSFGIQGGLRGEYTNRKFNPTGSDSAFVLERWDFFPTMHSSFKLSDKQQIMISYTRRIERPRGYSFEPFITWTDAYNVRRGNPDLKPEYIDAYELGYQFFAGKSIFSLEAYYRKTNNNIERVRTVYEKDITLHTFANTGEAYTFGSEFMINHTIIPMWNVNLMGNLYQYRLEGQLLGTDFSRESFNWNSRFNNTLNLGQNTRLQINAMYNSPSVSAQGTREGYATLNLGLRQELLNRALSLTLQVRDVFESAKHEFVSEGENFYSHSAFTRKAPMVTFSASYKIHNYEEKRNHKESDRNGNGDEEDF